MEAKAFVDKFNENNENRKNKANNKSRVKNIKEESQKVKEMDDLSNLSSLYNFNSLEKIKSILKDQVKETQYRSQDLSERLNRYRTIYIDKLQKKFKEGDSLNVKVGDGRIVKARIVKFYKYFVLIEVETLAGTYKTTVDYSELELNQIPLNKYW